MAAAVHPSPPSGAAAASSPPSISNSSTTTTKTSSLGIGGSKIPAAAKIKKYRDPLSPLPILDRRLLASALDDAAVSLKPGQLDDFYQLLHRQHYPSLEDFVATYRLHDAARTGGGDDQSVASASVASASVAGRDRRPLKNAVSAKRTKGNIRNLPRSFLTFLESAAANDEFVTVTSSIKVSQTSKDGTTTKLAVELQDGHVVEAVVMRHVSPTGSRATLCVSSQVGCAMGCTFCATGTMGIRGNLTSGEILEQLVHAGRILADETVANLDEDDEDEQKHDDLTNLTAAPQNKKKKHRHNHELVRNVVFMGMGEPLNNYPNVLSACRALIHPRRWNLAHGRVTVSTVGVIPKMRSLTRDLPEVSLALSLHAPNQEARTAIVPTAKQYPIEKLIDALDEHMMAVTKKTMGGNGDDAGGFSADQRKVASKQKRAMIEYVMLEGDTSTLECAHQLGKLCENRALLVNLIPYNQTDVRDTLRCPSREHMRQFQAVVMSYGALCVIRRTMGADIAGACGQLVVEGETTEAAAMAAAAANVVDIEEGPFRRATGDGATAAATASKKGSRSRRVSTATDDDERGGASGGGSSSVDGELLAAVDRRVPGVHDDNNNDDNDDDHLVGWVRPLAIATAVAASCFLVSGALVVVAQRRRR